MASVKNLVAAIFRFEHPVNPETINELLGSLNIWLTDRPDLRRMIALWLRATLMRKPDRILDAKSLDDVFPGTLIAA